MRFGKDRLLRRDDSLVGVAHSLRSGTVELVAYLGGDSPAQDLAMGSPRFDLVLLRLGSRHRRLQCELHPLLSRSARRVLHRDWGTLRDHQTSDVCGKGRFPDTAIHGDWALDRLAGHDLVDRLELSGEVRRRAAARARRKALPGLPREDGQIYPKATIGKCSYRMAAADPQGSYSTTLAFGVCAAFTIARRKP